MILSIQPQSALLYGVMMIIFFGLIFWPGKGILARYRKSRLNTRRVLMEDALKFIFDCEYKNNPCRLSSIAGNMQVSTDRATPILEHLQKIGLIKMQADQFQLTDAGRSYALQIIRVHRIWEHYLADETGVQNVEWHGSADLMEHQMSPGEADLLAAKMGNPVFDPHGDPIPSAKGVLPDHVGRTLSSLGEGDIARIVHVEDEPAAIYEQLVALDLYPGVQLYVMDVRDDRIQFAANGEECTLTPLFASSVTVELIQDEEPIQEKYEVLTDLQTGEKAKIVAISPKCRGQERRRIMDLGIIPGTVVRSELVSASGDPTAYKVLGATIAIRRKQAQNIFIERINGKANEK